MLRIFFTLGAIALAAQGAWADEWTKHWSVSGKPELHISAGDAAVVVEASNDHSIDAHITTVGWTIGPSGVRIEERQTGDKVQLDIKLPKTHWSMGRQSIKVEVKVPRELIGDLHTGDGSIVMRGLRGTLRADTGDGSIRGEDLDGSLDAHSGDGSVHVEGRFDKLQLHTQDGSIEAEVRDGSKLDGDWRIQTGDGSVHLRVPKSLAADLEARTGDGHISLSNLAAGSTTERDEHTRAAKLNGGGPALLLRTGDGSITVSNL